MTHSQYVESLRGEVGKKLIKTLCGLCPSIRCHYSDLCVCYWSLPEFTIRFDKGIVTPDGRYERCWKRFDTVLLVEPTVNSIAQQWVFKVAVEVKTNKNDLLSDDKISFYLGWTDYFFIAVPDYLMPVAIKKASVDSRIGVFSLNTGEITKMPSWQDVAIGRKCSIMEQAFFSYMKKNIPMISFHM